MGLYILDGKSFWPLFRCSQIFPPAAQGTGGKEGAHRISVGDCAKNVLEEKENIFSEKRGTANKRMKHFCRCWERCLFFIGSKSRFSQQRWREPFLQQHKFIKKYKHVTRCRRRHADFHFCNIMYFLSSKSIWQSVVSPVSTIRFAIGYRLDWLAVILRSLSLIQRNERWFKILHVDQKANLSFLQARCKMSLEGVENRLLSK